MHPDDSPPAGLPNLMEEIALQRRLVDHVKVRLLFLAADPDGELAQAAQVLAMKRGCRR